MDDEIPPLSSDSPDDDRDLPLPDATADLPHLRRELEESDDNHHEYDVVESLNQGNRDRQGSDDENEEGEERQRQRRHLLRLRLQDHGLSAGRHGRILDWAAKQVG
ncbi:hypothetical protein LXL04_024013 [Taraxacum kok-saghyz]